MPQVRTRSQSWDPQGPHAAKIMPRVSNQWGTTAGKGRRGGEKDAAFARTMF